MKILVTGSSGLIGGACVEYLDQQGHTIIGVDNNTREQLFGAEGRVWWNLHRIFHYAKRYTPINLDITNREEMRKLFEHHGPFDAIIHCAAQPSHDKSREIPFQDFTINAYATANLLELTRQFSPNAWFVFMSTNKVYGDAPNEQHFEEFVTRYDYPVHSPNSEGFDETTRIDNSTHSVFGASKAAADLLVQEYGRYFGLKTVALRAGCLTGPGHSGVQLHGFLSYLLKCAINGTSYTIFGYKGKQVRDNLHSRDVARIIEAIITGPERNGEVYNIGGGRENSCSMLEAITKIEEITGRKINYTYQDTPRVGDHICYITDMRKFHKDYPDFKLKMSLNDILLDMIYFPDHSTDHSKTLEYPELTESSVVFDVGGYKGRWSYDLAQRYNPFIYIFEPIPMYFHLCKRRFESNPKVKIFNFGFSDFTGSVSFGVDEVATGQFCTGKQTTVQVRDIASFLDEEKLNEVDLISLNAEGAEYTILNRLSSTGRISRFKNVQIQFHKCVPNSDNLRDQARTALLQTHQESFNYAPYVWESWKRRK